MNFDDLQRLMMERQNLKEQLAQHEQSKAAALRSLAQADEKMTRAVAQIEAIENKIKKLTKET
jgi:hypothetical protein